ncbi:MAG TPA: nucleoside triphosphate pyrophosphohydrolase [Gammaproteobacteria bacterium]|nr:nucleoside triphosphate pyrophosphohydrolase [Gammaproteobacteria bacterium]
MTNANIFDELIAMLQQLRDPSTGCPWDLQQTLESIVPHTIEEAYELAHAIEHKNDDETTHELGDLLLQILFLAQIGSEEQKFTILDICVALKRKLIQRHPHVFGNEHVKNAQEQALLWEKRKLTERKNIFAGIPHNLPALSRAQKIQKRVATVGFEFKSMQDAFFKIQEEVLEIQKELEAGLLVKAQQELGDLLFACCNLARFLDKDAEQLLRQATEKFERRFAWVEDKVQQSGKTWNETHVTDLEMFWQQAKRNLQNL